MSANRFLELTSLTAGSIADHISGRKWTATFRGGVKGFASTTVEIEAPAARRGDNGEYVELPPHEVLEIAQRLAAEFFLSIAFAGKDWMRAETRDKLTAAFPPKAQDPDALADDDGRREPAPPSAG